MSWILLLIGSWVIGLTVLEVALNATDAISFTFRVMIPLALVVGAFILNHWPTVFN